MEKKYQRYISMGIVTALFCLMLMAKCISQYVSYGYITPRGGFPVRGAEAIFIMVAISSIGIFSIFLGIYGARKYKKTTGTSYLKVAREQEEQLKNEIETTNYASYFDYKALFSYSVKMLLYGGLVYVIFIYATKGF